MTEKSRSYHIGLFKRLQDDEHARLYLQVALEDSREAFLVALRNVADARQFTKVARDSELDRVNLYRMLSENGNPTLSSLEKVLHALGLRLSIELESTSLVSAK
jgi:probable addiction module antidote protein